MKISGELLEDSNFESFIKNVKHLHDIGVPIILVYGGGTQITEEYKNNTGKTREKGKDGLNITSKELIDKGVIPASEKIGLQLEKAFGKENINIFEKEDMLCCKIPNLGEVGIVENFRKEFSEEIINILSFVGVSNINGNTLNINADDIVEKLSSTIKGKVSNIIFFTGVGGVLNNEGNLISFLTKEKLKKILDGNCDNIHLEGGMLKKMKSVYNLLKNDISKVTITSLEGLTDEIEGCGLGTMIVDMEKAKFNKISSKKKFDNIYDSNIKNGNWKKRTEKEKNDLFNNYSILKIDGTTLGGFALSDGKINGEKAKLLECLYTPMVGSGLGYTLGKEIKKNKKVYAYSKKGEFFENLGFKKIEGKKSKSGANLYIYSKE